MPTENEKQLTAMSEHIAWLEEVHAPIGIIKQAKSKLATERQQLIDGIDYCRDKYIDAENYFNNTFKTQ